jgi:hypothetical protein
MVWKSLACEFFLVGCRASASRRTPAAVPEFANIDLEFADGAAQGVAVHSQLPGSAALVAFVFLKDCRDEALFEFSDRFGIKDVALIHLVYECFQLIFHRILFPFVQTARLQKRHLPPRPRRSGLSAS